MNMIPATKLAYLDDTYLIEDGAALVRIDADERGAFLVLDRTILYPQGGGQPSDTGAIILGSDKLAINSVKKIDGEVRHYFNDHFYGAAESGANAMIKVDVEKRILHARYHTAGHLLSNIVESLSEPGSLVAFKGFQYPEGAYVEFDNQSGIDVEIHIDSINQKISLSIGDDLNILANYRSSERIEGHVNEESSRLVQIGNYPPIPCGGTHVSKLSELKNVAVTKAKTKKNITRISYALEL